MTKERKAKIARENGAKSTGPTTPEGKERTRANALKHGRRATTLRHLAEPHPIVHCNENGRAYYALFQQLIAFYRPIGPVALDIVRELTAARWEMTRAQLIKAANHNRAFTQEKHKLHQLPEQLIPVECALNSANALAKNDADRDRAIDRLLNRTIKLERRLRYLNTNFPSLGTEIADCNSELTNYEQTNYEPTNAEPIQAVENTRAEENTEIPLITDDPSAITRAAYEFFFPGRELLVIVPMDDEDTTKPN
jgi:hypothetical protein